MIALQHYFVAFLSSVILLNSVSENKKYNEHPTYVAVVQIDYTSQDKFVTLLCKTFIDDLELALQKKFTNKESIANPSDAKTIVREMDDYVKSHLQIKINGSHAGFSITNYKIDENNSVAIYFRINNIESINKIEITDTVFYELYDSQIQIIYVTVDGNRKSNKLRNPASKVAFDF